MHSEAFVSLPTGYHFKGSNTKAVLSREHPSSFSIKDIKACPKYTGTRRKVLKEKGGESGENDIPIIRSLQTINQVGRGRNMKRKLKASESE